MNQVADDDTKAEILQAWRESNNGPGEYLTQLRELQQKSVKEIATELGIGIDQVEALEKNDKDKLPAPIYIKSYIKRYCSCLGVSEADISNALLDISKDISPSLARVSLRQSTNVRQIVMRGVGYAILILFVGLLLYAALSIDISRLWESASSSSVATESEAMELSLPMVSDKKTPE